MCAHMGTYLLPSYELVPSHARLGQPADLILLGAIQGSAGSDALSALAAGYLPGVATVIVDGQLVVYPRSEQTTPPNGGRSRQRRNHEAAAIGSGRDGGLMPPRSRGGAMERARHAAASHSHRPTGHRPSKMPPPPTGIHPHGRCQVQASVSGWCLRRWLRSSKSMQWMLGTQAARARGRSKARRPIRTIRGGYIPGELIP